jgi:hypothetical protein
MEKENTVDVSAAPQAMNKDELQLAKVCCLFRVGSGALKAEGAAIRRRPDRTPKLSLVIGSYPALLLNAY